MQSRRANRLLIAGIALAATLPALASTPESLLPPGFGDPKATPTPTPAPTTPAPTAPTPPEAPPGFGPPSETNPRPITERARPLAPSETTDSAIEDLVVLPVEQPRIRFDLPPSAIRPTDIVGVIGIGQHGLPIDAFGSASGPFLGTLMERLDAPLPSRWASIVLRRALLSRVSSPVGLDPADWTAARTDLLVRMGEADGARVLSQAIDVANFTPAMIRAAFNASLASADPAGLCPIVDAGNELSRDAVWPMADAMCAAMEGEQARATTLLDQARRRGARGVDLLLAEKVIGAGSNTRRSVAIRWDAVSELNLWRFGLASATGAVPPEQLLAIAGPRTQAWLARAPMVPANDRLAAAEVAAALGVFSSASLIDAHALALDVSEAENPDDSAPGRLRTAYIGGTNEERISALRLLWDSGDDRLSRYARLILTAGAAARLEPAEALFASSDEIVGALMSAGMDNEAAAWASEIEASGSVGRAWALLAVGAPRNVVGIDSGRIDGFIESGASVSDRQSRFLVAALLGLGRIDGATAAGLGFEPAAPNGWTAALDEAAASSQPGTVALLAAVGLQSPDWSGVPPEHLYRVVAALRRVGLEFEARMIAAEALTRT